MELGETNDKLTDQATMSYYKSTFERHDREELSPLEQEAPTMTSTVEPLNVPPGSGLNGQPLDDQDEETEKGLTLMHQSTIANLAHRDISLTKTDITMSYTQLVSHGFTIFHPMYSVEELAEGHIRLNEDQASIEKGLGTNTVTVSEQIMKNATTFYHINSTLDQRRESTQRRFRNFEALHTKLAEEYPHFALPHLPEDLENRRENLQLYLMKLISHQGFSRQSKLNLPKLLTDFFNPNNEYEQMSSKGKFYNKTSAIWSKVMKKVDSVFYSVNLADESMTVLNSCIDRLDSLKNVAKEVNELTQKCDKIIKLKPPVANHAEEMLRLNQILAKAMSNFKTFQESIKLKIVLPAKDILKDVEYNIQRIESFIKHAKSSSTAEHRKELEVKAPILYHQMQHLYTESSEAAKKLEENLTKLNMSFLKCTHQSWKFQVKQHKIEENKMETAPSLIQNTIKKGPVDLDAN